MKKRLSPSEIRPALKALSQTNGVIIGGQAVNLWAEKFQKDESFWRELGPYTSYDLAVLGDQTDVLKCSRELDAEPFFPKPNENTANSGKIVTQIKGQEFEIDFLSTPSGLSPAEVRELARSITFEDEITLKVLHPIHCVESKTVNLMTMPQDAGERQDLKHLRLSIAILRQYLIELTLRGGNEKVLLRWANRMRTNANHDLGIKAAIKHGIDFRHTIPAGLWRDQPSPLADFVRKDWAQWEDETQEKITDIRELDAFLKSLNEPKRPGPNNPEIE
jgi:hypothetical protein